ncbi:ATP-dependent DNA helicase RecG [Rubritalea marina]|uniref:ATP-dependent DNA helicase RecG n=1 Tax=Rubritalea marina TaxID=361055 RepID=UPI000368142C|nr:ATP-dependent DNA helicase RecG [Rubritalea marina]
MIDVSANLESLGQFLSKELIALDTAQIHSVDQLLHHFPKRYEDRRQFGGLNIDSAGSQICLQGTVIDSKNPSFHGRRAPQEVKVAISNSIDGGSITLRWFNMPYITKMLAVGHEIVFFGKVKEHAGRLVIDHPEFEIIEEGDQNHIHVDRIVPVYRNIAGIHQKKLREHIYQLLEQIDPSGLTSLDHLDPDYSHHQALKDIHCPRALTASKTARRHFALDEFFKIQLQVQWRKENYAQQAGHSLGKKTQLLTQFYHQLPFDLTNSQKQCVKEIIHDMRSPRPMHRLLQGDVGAGKTFVAMCAALLAIESGVQVALMAPTQILAEQHYHSFNKWLDGLDIHIELLTGSQRKSNHHDAKSSLLIGTHALLFAEDHLQNLGLVIIDEQHKFGVEQRSKLINAGNAPDVLVMTATPIPRTLTMTLYGDLDVSVLTERPANRGKIVTGLRPKAKVSDITKFIQQNLQQGRQAYIVYPLVEDSETTKIESASSAFEKWQKRFKKHEVGLLHGKLSGEDKDAVMERFSKHDIDVLVATTVIEVGIDVPNANIMVIYYADRFGLSQLHQLRGRVGRGEHKSYCILHSDGKSPDGLEKLQILADSDDGFHIAEEDLRLRGPGNVLSTQQSGLSNLQFPEFLSDLALIQQAGELAKITLRKDPNLSQFPRLKLNLQAQESLRS